MPAQNFIAGDSATTMGKVNITGKDGKVTTVDKTWKFVKDDAGKLRIVAVNGSSRLSLLPDVPTYAELGIKGYEDMIFNGVFAPAGTPANLIESYSAAITKVVKSADFVEKLAALGINAQAGSAADLNARLKATQDFSANMVKNAGYKPQ